MAKGSNARVEAPAQAAAASRAQRTIEDSGIQTGEDFARLMSALVQDVVEGKVSPAVVNAACNAGGKLLKVVEMQYKYGGTKPERSAFVLSGPALRAAE